MASTAEQLAANFNFGAFSKATELKKRIWFTLIALVVYRLCTYVPLPGIDPDALAQVFQHNKDGILGMFNVFSGGALSRMSMLALSIFPYISASIIVQLLTAVSPKLEALKKEGESGRKKINQLTRVGTVLLATIQAYGIAVGIEGMSAGSVSVAIDPGMLFRVTAVISMVSGTLFLMWLGEHITSRGVGNGISLIIFSGIVSSFPGDVASLLQLGKTGAISSFAMMGVVLLAFAVVAVVVFFERAQRQIPIQYPKQQMGAGRAGQPSTSHLPLKLNASGVIPPIFAGALLGLPVTIAGFNAADSHSGWLTTVSTLLSHGNPVFMSIYGALIIFFAFFYTAIVFNPQETAENLRKYGGFVPGIRPGKSTGDYLDYVLTRLTVLGSVYLAGVCLLPELMHAHMAIPFTFGGTSMLIMVSVAMDTVAQVHSHMVAHQYESLMKKAKIRGKRK